MSEPDQIDMMTEHELRVNLRELVKLNVELKRRIQELEKQSVARVIE